MAIGLVKNIGFGEHLWPADEASVENAQMIYLIAEKILLCETIACAAVGVLALASVVVLPALSTLAVFGAGYAATAALTLYIYLRYRGEALAYYGVLPPAVLEHDDRDQVPHCAALPTVDGPDSFQWKKRLIENAQHNIVISGNYCGKKAFSKILECVRKRIEEVPHLKVVILSSHLFITAPNQMKIDSLHRDYPENFQLVLCPQFIYVGQGVKQSFNHVKVFVIDGGRYFLMGGTGIEDKYAYNSGLKPSKGKKTENDAVKGLYKKIAARVLPRGFRDMDFVFGSPDLTMGREVYLQSLRLIYRWEGINYVIANEISDQTPSTFNEMESVARTLLNEPSAEINTTIDEFEAQCIGPMPMRIFPTSPENIENPFEEALVEKLNKEKVKRIFISHMFFHPTEKIMAALANAVQRGAELTLVTNKKGKNNPEGHEFFADRNRYHYLDLIDRVGDEFRKNIHIFEFNVKKTTLHKKVIVIDHWVLAGSSNLGSRSLELTDYEMNFMVRSRKFARKVKGILRVDYEVGAQEVLGRPNYSIKEHLATLRHRMLVPFMV